MPEPSSPSRAASATGLRRRFRTTGLILGVSGAVAILVPAVATLVVEQLVGGLLVLWGGAGLLFSRTFRDFSEWRFVAFGFGAVVLVGVVFLMSPQLGEAFMTAVLVVVFLMEGVLSILLGLRMSGQIGNWQWIVVSGACAFVLGLIVLLQWPETERWVIGFMVGLNLLSTGVALLLLSRGRGSSIVG